MGHDFKVFKGSKNGNIVEDQGHREVGPTEAYVEITHCGVCGTDEHFRHADQGLGHEVIGVVKELGLQASRLSDLRVGDRVGMGWAQRFCMHCEPCLSGRHMRCLNQIQFGTGNFDQGGFATGAALDVTALHRLPDNLKSEVAGPLMCGGATVWGPLYQHGAKAGQRVGIVGVGGLGHLAIQFASKMGLEAVVFSSTDSKKDEAFKFGASEFHATKGVTKFEGVKPVDFLLITTNVLPDFNLYTPVLNKFAKIFPLTISFSTFDIPLFPLIAGGWEIIGGAGCDPLSMRVMLDFAAKHNIAPQIEKFPLSQSGITEAMKKLEDGKMRYRGVIEV